MINVKMHIEIGAEICKKIKHIYFEEIPWARCHKEVSLKFTHFKRICEKFYSELNEKDLWQTMNHFSHKDILEAFEDDELSHPKGG